MKRIWNGRLYLEGLKKIRILGIAASIVIIVSNALLPMTSFLISVTERLSGEEVKLAEAIPDGLFAPSMFLLMFFTPFFFYTMFSYLNSRKESDFYHAIPYSRTSVYLSFTAATFTWIFGILAASVSLNALLWFVNPYASFSGAAALMTLAEYAVATLFIGGISTIAVCLTGTKASQFFVTMILLFFIRISMILFAISVSELTPILDIDHSLLMLFSPRYYFPLSVIIEYFVKGPLSSPAVWIYTSVLAVASIAIGGVLYVRRKSETATKSAPNRLFQHVFRCLFTLPWVAGIGTLIIYEAPVSVIFVLSVTTAAIYVLYELITTKSGKSVLKSLPLLGVLVAAGLLFLGGAHAVRAVVLNQDYTTEDIESVGIAEDQNLLAGFIYYVDPDGSTYERQQTDAIMSEDQNAKELFVAALHRSIENVKRTGTLHGGYGYDYTLETILVKLRSGRTVGKNVSFTSAEYADFKTALYESPEYSEALIRMPAESEVIRVAPQQFGTDSSISKDLYRALLSDYNRLSKEEKLNYKLTMTGRWGLPTDCVYSVEVSGSNRSGNYMTVYGVPSSFENTTLFLRKIFTENQQKSIQWLRDFSNGKYDSFALSGENGNSYSTYIPIAFQTDKGEEYYVDILFSVNDETYWKSVKELTGMILDNAEWNPDPSSESGYGQPGFVRFGGYVDAPVSDYQTFDLIGKIRWDHLTNAQKDRIVELVKTAQDRIDAQMYVEPVYGVIYD
ncbi:MAG: hypothetical protein ILO68_06565 [Clostridia bacterium]|nr:hypothetical protein [Clostridia bacterium]